MLPSCQSLPVGIQLGKSRAGMSSRRCAALRRSGYGAASICPRPLVRELLPG